MVSILGVITHWSQPLILTSKGTSKYQKWWFFDDCNFHPITWPRFYPRWLQFWWIWWFYPPNFIPFGVNGWPDEPIFIPPGFILSDSKGSTTSPDQDVSLSQWTLKKSLNFIHLPMRPLRPSGTRSVWRVFWCHRIDDSLSENKNMRLTKNETS